MTWLKLLTGVLKLVDRYGYVKFSFGVLIIATAIIVPGWIAQRTWLDRSSEPNVVIPTLAVDTSAQIQEILERILVDQGATRVGLSEMFTTRSGEIRGTGPDGYWVMHNFTHTLDSPPFPAIMLHNKQFVSHAMRSSDNSGFIFLRNLEVNRFHIEPDTSSSSVENSEEIFGLSYYVIAGYNLQGRMVVCVHINFFGEVTVLTRTDLERSVNEVQEIVALLVK